MQNIPPYLDRLGLDAEADEKQVKRAYASLLKQIDQEAEASKFQQLRQDYQDALAYVQFQTVMDSTPFKTVGTIEEAFASLSTSESPKPAENAEPSIDLPMDAPQEVSPPEDAPLEVNGETATQEEQEALVFLSPTDQANRQLDVLRSQLQHRNLSEVHEILQVLNECLNSEDLLSLEARGAFEMSLISSLIQGEWKQFSGPLLCAGNLCFKWSTALRAQFSMLVPVHAQQLEALLDDISQLDTLAIESWCRWAKIPNATPIQSLLGIENTRHNYPALSQFFFDSNHVERLESEAQSLRRPFEQFKRQVLYLSAPNIEELDQLLRPFAGDATFENLLVQAIAKRQFEQNTAALLFAAKSVFQWLRDSTEVLTRYGPDGEAIAKVIMEVGAFSTWGAGKWVHWAQSAEPHLARQARLKIDVLRPNHPHACALFFPREYLLQLQQSENLDTSFGGRVARIWDKLNGGGVWNVFGNLLVIAVVVGVVIRLFGVMTSHETVKNAGQCDTQIAAGIGSNWEKMNTKQLQELRKCLDMRRLPVMCSDRKGLQELLNIQNLLGDRYSYSDSLDLVFKPAPGRFYELPGAPSCKEHERLIYYTEWLRAIDKTTLENSVKALGRCSVEPGAVVSSGVMDSAGQNGRLFRAALLLTKEWQSGSGKSSRNAISFEELITQPTAPVVNWSDLDAARFQTHEPCITSAERSELSKAEAGPKETDAVLQRSKLTIPQ